jgi:hydroxyquinol 1,2-dioxygenase
MIIKTQLDVTVAVLAGLAAVENPRQREILMGVAKHLHAFVRDVKLTEPEFQQACALIARLGQASSPSHNEVVLAAGSLGVSSLVCLLNNAVPSSDGLTQETTANMLGPFWRADSPRMENGQSIVRSPTPGESLFVECLVLNESGQQIAGANVDVWHSSSEGFYENQDPTQADMNLRGQFLTDEQGRFSFQSIKPVGYPIPVNGPVGDLLRLQGRHNMRPAHLHFMIRKAGYKSQFSQVYSGDDPHLETDVQFGVTQRLVGHYKQRVPNEDGLSASYSLNYTFVLQTGESRSPIPPITEKNTGPRPTLTIIKARG